MTLEDLPVTMTISQVKAKLAAEKNMENDDTLRFIWGGKNLIDGEQPSPSIGGGDASGFWALC